MLDSYNLNLKGACKSSTFALESAIVRDNSSSFLYDFSSKIKTEKTVFALIVMLGLSIQISGTTFLVKGLLHYLNYGLIPSNASEFYKLVAAKYGITAKCAKMAIVRSIEDANIKTLQKANKVFNAEIVSTDDVFRVGEFIVKLCAGLVILKLHQEGKTLFKY